MFQQSSFKQTSYDNAPPVTGFSQVKDSGTGGPNMFGEYTSIETGETVFVRDTVIIDDKMQVRLTDDTIIPLNDFSNRYFKLENDNIYSGDGTITGKVDKMHSIVSPTLNTSKFFEGMDTPIEKKVSVSSNEPFVETVIDNGITVTKPSVIDTNINNMVQKLFTKKELKEPQINIELIFENLPKNELNVLKDCFDVSNDDITKTIIEFFHLEDIIKNKMTEVVSNLLND